MNQEARLKTLKTIRIGSKWSLKENTGASYYTNIGPILLGPHEHVEVELISISKDEILISVIHRSGYTSFYEVERFLRMFEEIEYQDVKLKDYVNDFELIHDIKTKFNVNINPYYNSSSRTIRVNETTFDIVVNHLEKNLLVDMIISKKEIDYLKHSKKQEIKNYGLPKSNKLPKK